MQPQLQPGASPELGRLLLVEDDAKLAATVARGLRGEGYDVDVAAGGEQALEQAFARDYDAIILDVLLPGLGGHAVCRTLRQRDRWVPVLMLTALDEVSDRIQGLDAGADDYLVKPFDFGELLARLRALIRRGPSERPAPLQVGELHADPLRRRVSWGEREASLTPREFELLAYLMRRPGETVSRAQLIDHVWADGSVESPGVVEVYVGYLRRKLEGLGQQAIIRTVRGEGYALVVARGGDST